MKTLTLLLTVILGLTSSLHAQTLDHSHAALTAVLRNSVRNGLVNYAALKANPAPLSAYLNALTAVPESTFNSWSHDQRLTFLINFYNAATLKFVIDHYPVKSIKDISGFLKGPWDQPVVHVFGQTVTLNHIEHDIIRPQYNEPRAHFALVCASLGCPPLRPEAYQATRLDAQLQDQGRIFLATPSKNRVDLKTGTLHLSPIFKWFPQDFTFQSGSVEKFIAPWFSGSEQSAILSGKLNIKYTGYSWSLNKQ